ncbi:hypothetical protein [Gordonia paraffinivorans]|uniref:Uncharacterized protein n=2 Tax=Gordonia paraffinivorans TaxID=175628 RepID=A0ABQ0IJA0_9ACTN|nr:hypothetical protein [Gordonia paraffinivorans]MBY4573961.1 hypothetical protein [Gordonia paraffinivorans]MCD2143947.1 hypothetical protein [Gordonia paraffinivorans]PWD44344.1 hypothetical protein ACN93_02685 [Gordonia paraffinivorans]VFA83093.1 Uncharacterised protein [Gordonia paraffinivorans]GAC83545.1 hypothetical protein GP2_013_00220 [Gordonia paraffinivorans NBRC 108238]
MTDALALLERAAEVVAELGPVERPDAESVVVQVGPTRASIRVVTLADGLDVLAVTQMVAMDLPNTPDLRDDVEAFGARMSFGSLRRSDPAGVTTDVLQYYTFPAGRLEDLPLLMVLHIVLANGVDAAERLTGKS